MKHSALQNERIAIFGATGYIGRSLIAEGVARDIPLMPFSRDKARAEDVFQKYGVVGHTPVASYEEFLDTRYDVIINATGVGSPSVLKEGKEDVFNATESVDARLFAYLTKFPRTRVFNLSTGAVYGRSSREVITRETRAVFDPEKFDHGDQYALAKLVSEAKHRARPELSIIDLRVFAFVSRFLDTEEAFFISQVAKSLKEGGTFRTGPEDMVRDYTSAAELLDIILFLTEKEPANFACNVESRETVSKHALLSYLAEHFGLRVEIDAAANFRSPTGQKNAYYSNTRMLESLGLKPKATSREIIDREIRAFLKLPNIS